MKVRAKRVLNIREIVYSVGSGCLIMTSVTPEQVWNARKGGRYWTLSRKGVGYTMRFTESAFERNFEEVQ